MTAQALRTFTKAEIDVAEEAWTRVWMGAAYQGMARDAIRAALTAAISRMPTGVVSENITKPRCGIPKKLDADIARLRRTVTSLMDEGVTLKQEIERLRAALQKVKDQCERGGPRNTYDVAAAALRNPEQQAPKPMSELDPHAYVPSATHQGDCAVCGHLQGAAIHSPSRRT